MLTTEKKAIAAEINAELAEVYGGEGVENLRFRSKWYAAGVWPFRRISFECPGCSRWLSVGTSQSGRTGFCPSCDLTLSAPDLAKELPPSLVSTKNEIPALPARRLPDARPPSAPAEIPGNVRAKPEQSPELTRFGSIPEEGKWGIREDRSFVPIRVVTRYQAIAPWLGIFALLVAAGLVAYAFTAVQTDRDEAEIPSIHPAKVPAKVPLGSELWVVLDALAMAETPDELLSLVRTPKEIAPKLRAYYAENPIELPHRFERARAGVNVYQLGSKRFARFEGRCDGRPVKFTFEGTEYGWRLDWESLVGYSDMSWSKFLSERPAGERQFRVLAKVSGDELLAYDRNKYICMQLTDHFETGDGFALVERYGNTAAKLEKFLNLHANSRGNSPRTWITPVLRPLEGSDELLEMVDLASASWLIP